jgi:hypothetical protein
MPETGGKKNRQTPKRENTFIKDNIAEKGENTFLDTNRCKGREIRVHTEKWRKQKKLQEATGSVGRALI